MFRSRQARFTSAFATAFAGLVIAVAPALPASAAVTISGTITCLNSPSPVGVWVDAQSSTDGWAFTKIPIRIGGMSQVTYTYTLNNGGNFKVNVGCGGTSQKWGMSLSSGVVSGPIANFRCNDIPPWLGAAAKRLLRVDLTNGIPYGTCKQV